MNTEMCAREEELNEAIRTGRWPEDAPAELHEHVERCAACSEWALVAAYFRREAQAAESEADLPDPGFVWWKARLATRRAAMERAMRPVVLAQRAGLVAGTLAAGGLVAWQWPRLSEWLAGADWASFARVSSWTGLFAGSLAGALVVAGIGLYLIWSER